MSLMLQDCFKMLKLAYEKMFSDRELKLTHTLRTLEEQQKLYKIGRSGIKGEKIVTNCDGVINKSKHQEGKAFDIAVFIKGKPEARWDVGFYMPLGRILDNSVYGDKIQWGGRFEGKFKDYPHFEEI